MWPLVAFAILYPLSVPTADLLTKLAGRVPGDPSPGALRFSLAFYLAVLVVLGTYAFAR